MKSEAKNAKKAMKPQISIKSKESFNKKEINQSNKE